MIFRRELSRNWKSLLIWSLVLGALVMMMLSIYPQMAEQQQGIEKLMEAYPETLKKAFGMDKLPMSSLIGFYGVEIHGFILAFVGSFYAAMLAGSMISKEENEKTIEFLLSKPVTRSRIVTEKLLAVIVNIAALNVFLTLVSFAGFQFAKDPDVPVDTFLLLALGALLLHLTFAAVAFFLSAIIKKARNILSASLGIVIISYFLGIAAGVSEKLENLQYVSFFKYVDAGDIVVHNALEPVSILVMAGVAIIGVGLAYLIFARKDIAV